jgi:hypothetical protein
VGLAKNLGTAHDYSALSVAAELPDASPVSGLDVLLEYPPVSFDGNLLRVDPECPVFSFQDALSFVCSACTY